MRSFSPFLLLCGAVPALGLTLGIAIPGAAQEAGGTASEPPPTPMQVYADVALVDARCRMLTVDFGALFQWGEAHGLPSSAVLPFGRLRKVFEAAYARRAAAMTGEAACDAMAEEADEAAPGVIRGR